jgi:hypothetical protein
MDPDACLLRFLDAIEDGDDTDREWAAEDLVEWCARGGFDPRWSKVANHTCAKYVADLRAECNRARRGARLGAR